MFLIISIGICTVPTTCFCIIIFLCVLSDKHMYICICTYKVDGVVFLCLGELERVDGLWAHVLLPDDTGPHIGPAQVRVGHSDTWSLSCGFYH
jgi:hypothetical protein